MPDRNSRKESRNKALAKLKRRFFRNIKISSGSDSAKNPFESDFRSDLKSRKKSLKKGLTKFKRRLFPTDRVSFDVDDVKSSDNSDPESRRKARKKALAKFKKRLFKTTGISFDAVVKGFAFVAILLVLIGLTVLYTNFQEAGKISGIEAVKTKQLSSEEQFIELSKLPPNFSKKPAVEKIDILKSKIEVGEELVSAEGPFAERGTDRLMSIYGRLCLLQEVKGIDSKEIYEKLAKLRERALAAGNEERVAAADIFRALAAIGRLNQSSEEADFTFASDAVSVLDSKNLVDAKQNNRLYLSAIKIHDTLSKPESTESLLAVLGDKLTNSPAEKVSNLGLNLQDHVRYGPYYGTIDKQPYTTTREAKLQFFRELFAKIDEAPPQSIKTYQVVFQLLDRLLNKSDAFFVSTLTKRLGEAASTIKPNIKVKVQQSIANIETRIAKIGQTVDLSGSNYIGKPLQLPNGKPTTIVFWRFGNAKSMEYLKSVVSSGLYNPWENNLLMACLSDRPVDEFKEAARTLGRFTILDYATAHRLEKEFKLELVPYQVSLDKDGKVIRLGAPFD